MNSLDINPDLVQHIVKEAEEAARVSAQNYFENTLKGQDNYPCGFAWIKIFGVKGNTKLGKALMRNGFAKSYTGGLELRNPSRLPVQNVDVKEVGAEAAADVFRRYGFKCYSQSRLD